MPMTPTGLTFDEDGEAVVKERIYLDKADSNTITTTSPPSTMR